MRKSSVIPNASSRKPIIFRLGVILLLVLCALLLQRFVEQMTTWRSLNQAEFIEHLRGQGVEVANMGTGVAPLTIHGERLRLSGGELVEPVEITVYEDSSNAVEIRNNIITSQANSASSFWVNRDGSRSPTSPEVIDVSQWPVPLHVFQQGQLIVLYGGSDTGVVNLLSKVVGRRVAGP